MATETDDPLIGTEIGRYRLTRLLGEGGMGRVYLAVQPAIGSRVAVKVLSMECARTPDLLERFFAEARAVNLIHHEGIVNVLDMAVLPDGRPYIVMEFVEGGTLADALRAGPLPLGGLVQVATEVFSALAAAHAIGIVHRDLKPDNVLVTAEGHAKVLDFGIAKLAPGLQQGVSPRTQTGALLGTPHYMAPEQIRGASNIDARADVYAAGVMLFEAITGQRPFDGETLYDLMHAHLEKPPPSLRALRPELPIAMEHVILTALAKNPDERFQTVTAFGQALNQAAAELPPEEWRPLSSRTNLPHVSRGGLGSGASSRSPAEYRATVPSPTPAPVNRSRWPLIAVAGAVVVVIIILIAVFHESGAQVAQVPSDAPAAIAMTPTRAPNPAPAGVPVAEPAGSATELTPKPAPAVPPISRAPVTKAAVEPAPDNVPSQKVIDDAAKHGVIIGKNVTIGHDVVIGGNTPAPAAPLPKTEHPIDYDPKHFDGTAYAPKAYALAKAIYPDASFVRFDIVNVYPDGHADLTLTDDHASYLFRSPAHSKRPTDVPANLPVNVACYVEVTVGPRSIEVRARDMDPIDPNCKWPLRRFPTCSVAKIWDVAKAAGAKTNTIAKVEFLEDGKWFFDNEYAGTGMATSFADKCP